MAPGNHIKLIRTNSSNAGFRLLIPLLDKELQDRYGAIQSTYDQFNHIIDINTVVVAYHDHIPVGCGCFKQMDDTAAEIKRMFVNPANRGQGIAIKIVNELEAWAKETGFSHTVLETGDKQPEAITLYQKAGYTTIPNYGQYAAMENSICMRKEL